MPDMQDAFALARTIDARLEHTDAPSAEQAVDDFREALYDYRADGDLDAFLDRCRVLLAELGSVPRRPTCRRPLLPRAGLGVQQRVAIVFLQRTPGIQPAVVAPHTHVS